MFGIVRGTIVIVPEFVVTLKLLFTVVLRTNMKVLEVVLVDTLSSPILVCGHP